MGPLRTVLLASLLGVSWAAASPPGVDPIPERSQPQARPAAQADSAALRMDAQLGLLRRDPRALRPHLALGEAYYRIGNDRSARFHLEEFLLRAPAGSDSLRAAHLEARALIRQGLERRAIRILQRLVRRPGAPAGAWHDLSLLLRRDGFVAEALMAEMQAGEASEGEPAYLREAAAQWKAIGRYEQGLRLFHSLRERGEADPEDYFQAGYLAHLLRRPEQARAAYEANLALDPGHAEGHYNLALLLDDAGETMEAASHLREVLRLRPAYEPAYFHLGALLLQAGREAEAVDVFRRYLQAGRDSVALAEAAWILQTLGWGAVRPDSVPALR